MHCILWVYGHFAPEPSTKPTTNIPYVSYIPLPLPLDANFYANEWEMKKAACDTNDYIRKIADGIPARNVCGMGPAPPHDPIVS